MDGHHGGPHIFVPQKQGSLMLLSGAPVWCSYLVLLLALAWEECIAPVVGLRAVSGPGELQRLIQVCLPGDVLVRGGPRMVRS